MFSVDSFCQRGDVGRVSEMQHCRTNCLFRDCGVGDGIYAHEAVEIPLEYSPQESER